MLTFDNDGNILVFSEKKDGKKKGFFKKHWKKLLAAGVGAAGLAAAGYGLHKANKEAKRRYGDEANATWLLNPGKAKLNHEIGKAMEADAAQKRYDYRDLVEARKEGAAKILKDAEDMGEDLNWDPTQGGSPIKNKFNYEKNIKG